MATTHLPPVHPGEILHDMYLAPLGMSPYRLARHINVPRTRIERIIKQQVGITTDTALRLARFFKTTPEFWMNLQSGYDLKVESVKIAGELAAIEPRQDQ
jgi:addiction module HigA family antidote